MGLINNLKEQKLASQGFTDYCTNSLKFLWENFFKKSCITYRMVLLVPPGILTIYIMEVVMGSVSLESCPTLEVLPIYCLSIGVISIISSVAMAYSIMRSVLGNNSEEELSLLGKIGIALRLLIHLAMVGWFITGSVWVFNLRPCTDIQLEELNNSAVTCYTTDVTYNNTSVYCDEQVFGMTLAGIGARWGIIALIIAISILFFCPICYVYFW